jgi:N-acetylmuramoyl-L-alanine amidase
MREINRIIIHHADTPANMDIGVEEIRRWHLSRGWRDVGYHYIIRRDGDLDLGRPVEQMGAHARGSNHDSIGICLVGGKPEVNFTQWQWEWLAQLVKKLMQIHPAAIVLGHKDVAATKCPGFDVSAWWDERAK